MNDRRMTWLWKKEKSAAAIASCCCRVENSWSSDPATESPSGQSKISNGWNE